MGKVSRKRHGAEFKARVALEAIRGEQTLAEIGAKHGVHLTMVAAWKKAAIEGMTATFSPKAAALAATSEADLSVRPGTFFTFSGRYRGRLERCAR